MRAQRGQMFADRLSVAAQQRTGQGMDPATQAVVERGPDQRRQQRAGLCHTGRRQRIGRAGDQRHQMIGRMAERGMIEGTMRLRDLNRAPTQ